MAAYGKDAHTAQAGEPVATAAPAVKRVLRDWRAWRRARPFWGGLLVVLGGGEMLLSELASLPLVIHIGLHGLASYLVPVLLVACGLLLWFHPPLRTLYSVLAILLALGSWITSNLGGFFVGMLLCLIGGSLAFAWVSGGDRRAGTHRRRREGKEPPAGPDLMPDEPPTVPELGRPDEEQQAAAEDETREPT